MNFHFCNSHSSGSFPFCNFHLSIFDCKGLTFLFCSSQSSSLSAIPKDRLSISVLVIVGESETQRRIRIVSHNASDKVILPRLFQIWCHFQVATVQGRRVLNVQLKQSNFMTSTGNVNKLCLFVQETEHLQVKLTMMVCPERISNVYNFT